MKYFTIGLLAVLAMLAIVGCGSGGNGTTTANNDDAVIIHVTQAGTVIDITRTALYGDIDTDDSYPQYGTLVERVGKLNNGLAGLHFSVNGVLPTGRNASAEKCTVIPGDEIKWERASP